MEPGMPNKNCFDACTQNTCMKYGHDVGPYEFCLADPVVDRYEKQARVGKPCRDCAHRHSEDRCWVCTNNGVRQRLK